MQDGMCSIQNAHGHQEFHNSNLYAILNKHTIARMEVTEHNITDWNLSTEEITELIRLTKDQMIQHSDNKAKELWYGLLLGKLIIMKNA